MSFFSHVCLIEAPQAVISPFPRYISDCIGICYLASAVEQDVESLVIPDNYYNDGVYDSFRTLLRKQPVDLVAISSMTGCFNNALRLAGIAKEHDVFVVMGGFHPTALPEEVLRHRCVDAVAIGEGEATFRDLVLYGPSKEVPGLAYRENGGITFTGPRPIIGDIDSIAFPFRSLRPARYGEKGNDYSIDTIYTSRGCPWSCSFCANDTMHKGWRGRSPENVVEEFALLHDHKKKKLIKIWDANFLTNIKRAETICDMMIERGLTNFRIMTETRAKDLIRAERILGKLRKIGLSKVGLGIESPNTATLELMNKKNVLDDVSRAIALVRKNGVGAEGYFIIGHYTETVEDTLAYPEFAKNLGLRQALFMSMTPYPGTKIFDEYKSENKITSFDWDLYNNFCPVVSTRSMDTSTLVEMMVYCNVAFCNYRSVLKRNSVSTVLIAMLKDLFQLCFLMRVNKTLDDRVIIDTIYQAFTRYAGRKPQITFQCRPADKPLKSPVVISIRRSSREAVDFIIEQRGDLRRLSISIRQENALASGAIIRLDEVVAASGSLSMDSLMRLLFRNELIRNNPGSMAGQIFSISGDPVFWRVLRRLYALYAGSFRKTPGFAG
ncbi:MAG: B12-binding domain-containing radical SAM protein [Chlorobium sp.]|uniref:B12-binding domain-containing radical SAM protein n=1 Tax=Chlorobium sp. TaxID=1095 RepID=UPI0025BA0779|nr:radical SAM protein [Chlorobium sp.]MCF8216917.1 B12-binding domain-containing radical SAM protein [Chlorobium sp.]MCF8271757.1 B12-binding domain-containing radical SAM protein [Chlorobium sp.]MCF8288134.1 B12-binding domain-containing radical SAM protein [Chlorobium sp.]MCF8291736.1 B12-binding domain-containing radical SAM protein [Chlorobium sp.]MCF8385817.1 B12-binding domain-containing radical SAM protein [Chlorobium sp.]